MASRRDAMASFTCRRFEELFASSPRAKEIFASFYEKGGEKTLVVRENLTRGCEKSEDEIKGADHVKGGRKGVRIVKTKSVSGNILNNNNSSGKPDGIDGNHNFVDFSKTSLSGEFRESSLPGDTSCHRKINDVVFSGKEDEEYNDDQTTLSQEELNNVSFPDNEEDEQNGLGKFSNQVLTVLKKLDEVEGQMTKQKEQAMTLTETKKNKHHVCNWSLRTVETNNEKQVIIEGERSGDSAKQNWRSTVVCQRLSSRCVRTKSGSAYHLVGKIDENIMTEKGFSEHLIRAFKNGFPVQWKRVLEKHYEEIERSGKKSRNAKKEKENQSKPNLVERKDNIGDKEKKKDERKVDTREEKTRNENKAKAKKQKNAPTKAAKITTPLERKTNNSKKTGFQTPLSVITTEEEVKKSRSGRIIAPPLEYWRGQRMISQGPDDSITIVTSHREENSVHHVKRSTPLSRKEFLPKRGQAKTSGKLKASQYRRDGSDISRNQSTTTYFSTSERTSDSQSAASDPTWEGPSGSTDQSEASVVTSDTQSESTVAKILTYTSTDSVTDGTAVPANEFKISRKSRKSDRTVEARAKSGRKEDDVRAALEQEERKEDWTQDGLTSSHENVRDERASHDDGMETDDVDDERVNSQTKMSEIRSRLRSATNKSDTGPASGRKLRGGKIIPRTATTVGKQKQRLETRSESKRPARRGRANVVNNEAKEFTDDGEHKSTESSDGEKVRRVHSTREKLAGNDNKSTQSETQDVRNTSRLRHEGNNTSLERKASVDVVSTDSEDLRGMPAGTRVTRKSQRQCLYCRPGRKTESYENGSSSNTNTGEQLFNIGKVFMKNKGRSRAEKNRKVTSLVRGKRVKKSITKNDSDFSGFESENAGSAGSEIGAKSGTSDVIDHTTSSVEGNGIDVIALAPAVKSGVGKTNRYRLRDRSQLNSPGRVTKSEVDPSEAQAKKPVVPTASQASRDAQEVSHSEVNAVEPVKVTTWKQTSDNERKLRKKNVPGIQGPVESTDEEMWMADEHDRLIQALSTVPPATAMYWQKVAQLVKTRNAEECQLHIQDDVQKPKKKVARKIQEKPVTQKLTAKAGTLARKRQLRDILEHQDDGYEDDIFDSTPFRNKKLIKYQPVDIDDEDLTCEAETDTDQDGKTPSSRTPMNRLRPPGPLSASGASETDCTTPGLLKSVNRNAVDRYVHQLKKRRVGRNMKKVTTHTPMAKKTPEPHPLCFDEKDCFNLREATQSEVEGEEDQEDYYWSDED